MKGRVWIDRAVNLSMLWSGALLVGSGLVLKYRVGYDSPRGATVWGMDGQDWGRMHWTLGLVVVSLLCLHLLRHRRWLWSVLAARMSPAMAAVLLVALLLVLLPLVMS